MAEAVLGVLGLIMAGAILFAVWYCGGLNHLNRRKLMFTDGTYCYLMRETQDGARVCTWGGATGGAFVSWEDLARFLDGEDAEWARSKLAEKQALQEVNNG